MRRPRSRFHRGIRPASAFAYFAVAALPQVLAADPLSSPNGQSSGYFGTYVGVVDDITGDGKDDIIAIGREETIELGSPRTGRAYAFDGGAEHFRYEFPATASGDAPVSDFSSITGIGDVTGDGRNDVIMGSSETNAAFVFDGWTGELFYRLTGPETSYFGTSVTSIHDMNKDAYPDFAVGAPLGADASGSFAYGNVKLFSGSTGVELGTIHAPNPTGLSENFGHQVAVGDFNGAGDVGLVISAPAAFVPPDTNAGEIHVFSGSTFVRTISSPGSIGTGQFGWDVATLRTTAVSHAEIIVSAIQETAGEGTVPAAGRAYVINGLTGAARLTLESPLPSQSGNFGWAVASIPDVDGDGSDDVAVSAPNEKHGKLLNAGRVHLFSGVTGNLIRTIVSPQPVENGFFGRDVAGMPDHDGDGHGDLVIGANGEDQTKGRVHIISGATGLPTMPTGDQLVVNALVGHDPGTSGLNANGDGAVDVADLVFVLAGG